MGSMIADLIFVIIGILIVVICGKRGFIKNVLYFARTFLALASAYLFGGRLANFLCDTWIGGAVRNFMYQKVSALYADASGTADTASVIETLPPFLRTEEVQTKLDTLQASEGIWIDGATDAISAPIASLISNVLGYVAVFVLTLIALWLLVKILDATLSHTKLLGTMNTVLGMVWGALLAVMIFFVTASLIKLFFGDSAFYTESSIVRFFGDSLLLKAIKIFDVGNLLLTNLFG